MLPATNDSNSIICTAQHHTLVIALNNIAEVTNCIATLEAKHGMKIEIIGSVRN